MTTADAQSGEEADEHSYHAARRFYLPEKQDWQAAVDRMMAAGYRPVQSFNPYWDRSGRTFEDPDGYRVVLQNSSR